MEVVQLKLQEILANKSILIGNFFIFSPNPKYGMGNIKWLVEYNRKPPTTSQHNIIHDIFIDIKRHKFGYEKRRKWIGNSNRFDVNVKLGRRK